jgi:hypothetical protein
MNRKQQREETSSDENEDDEVPNQVEKESLDDSHQSLGVKSKRGRPKIPEQWTRVINITTDDIENLRVYPLATDLLFGNAMKGKVTRGRK